MGTQHQAGSDSYLTGAAFFKMKQVKAWLCHIQPQPGQSHPIIFHFRSSLMTTLMRRGTVVTCLDWAIRIPFRMGMGTHQLTPLNDHSHLSPYHTSHSTHPPIHPPTWPGIISFIFCLCMLASHQFLYSSYRILLL